MNDVGGSLMKRIASLVAVVLCCHCGAPVDDRPTGIVVEPLDSRIESSLELTEGDVLIEWELTPFPGSSPGPQKGSFSSTFDWKVLCIEQLPRGELELTAERNGETFVTKVPGNCQFARDLGVRPRFSEEVQARYREIVEQEATAIHPDNKAERQIGLESAAQRWQGLAGATEDEEIRAFFLYKAAMAQYKTNKPEQSLEILERLDRAADCCSKPESKAYLEYVGATLNFKLVETLIRNQEYGGQSDVDSSALSEMLRSSRERFERALKHLEKHDDQAMQRTWALRGLALTEMLLADINEGPLDEAQTCLDRAAASARNVGVETEELDKVLNNLAMLARTQERPFDDVKELELNAAENKRVLVDRGLVPESWNCRQVAHLVNLGAYDWREAPLWEVLYYQEKAIEHLEVNKCEEFYEPRVHVKHWQSTAEHNMGEIYELMGFHASAREHLERAFSIRQEYRLPGISLTRKSLGSVYRELGLSEKAVEFLEPTHDRQFQTTDERNIDIGLVAVYAESRRDQAMQYCAPIRRERLREVRALLQRWIAKLQSSPGRWRLHCSLGSVEILLGDFAAAGREFDSARALLDARDSQDDRRGDQMLRVVTGQCDAAARFGADAARTQKLCMEALKLCEQLRSPSAYRAVPLASLARASAENGENERALEYLDRALSSLDDQSIMAGSTLEQAAAFLERHGYREYAQYAISLLLKDGRTNDSLTMLERSRAWLTEAHLAPPESNIERASALRRKEEQTRILGEVEVTAAFSRSLSREELESEIEDLESEIETLNNEVGEAQSLDFEPLGTEAISAVLPENAMLVAFDVAEENLRIFSLRHGDQEVKVVSNKASRCDLRDRVKRFVKAVRDEKHVSEIRSKGRALARDLLLPVADELQDIESLIIVPDVELYDLPWGCLVVDDVYLTERFSISVTFSASLYARHRARKRPPTPKGLLAVAVPTISDRPEATNAPRASKTRDTPGDFLPWAEAEADAIAKHFQGLDVPSEKLAREDATVEAVTRSVSGHRWLHFACHGTLDPETPTESAIELYDGPLSSAFVARNLTIDAELVVLSACDSATSSEPTGAGLMALTRAFLKAGASRVVGSLWSVDDASSFEFWNRFYEHYLTEGLPVHAAISATQKGLISGAAGKKYSHPRHWAGFQVVQGW